MAKPKKSSTSSRKFKEFTCFKKFPPEIRDTVWKLALLDVNTVEIYVELEQPYGGWGAFNPKFHKLIFKASYTVPPLLHVSKESRTVAKKQFIKFMDSQMGDKPVYLNPDLDILVLRNVDTLRHICYKHEFDIDMNAPQNFTSPILAKLRCLQLPKDAWCYLHDANRKKILEVFGKPEIVNLQRLMGRGGRIHKAIFFVLESRIDERAIGYKLDLYNLKKDQLAELVKSIDNPPQYQLLKPTKPAKTPKAITPPTRRSARIFTIDTIEYHEVGEEDDDEDAEAET